MSISIQVNPDAGKPGNNDPAVIRPDALFPVTRQLGYYLSLLFIRLPVSANQVTFLSMIIGLSGSALFLKGEFQSNIYGALLLVLSYALDYCDGVIARLRDQSSAFGAAFDDFVDWIVDTAFFASLGFGTWSATDENWWLWLGLIAAVGSTIDYIIDLIRLNRFKIARLAAEKQASGETEPEPENSTAEDATFRKKLFYVFHTLSRAEFCIIVLVLSAFDVVWVLLPFGAIGAQAFWLGDLFRKHD